MSRRIIENRVCPFCRENVYFRPEITHDEVQYSQTKRGTRQYFHKSCYMKNTRKGIQ